MSSNTARFGVNFMVIWSLFWAPTYNSWASAQAIKTTTQSAQSNAETAPSVVNVINSISSTADQIIKPAPINPPDVANILVAPVDVVLPPPASAANKIGLDLDTWITKDYFTLAPDVKVEGPIFPSNPDVNILAKRQYVSQVFRRLIQKADRVAKSSDSDFMYVENATDNFSYYAFLILALVVPHHESQLMHAREVTGDKCVDAVNNFTDHMIKDHVPVGKSVLENLPKVFKIYRNQNPILIPDCRQINKTDHTRQLLISDTYQDVGIMQINAKSHPEIVEPATYLSVFDSIDYGIDFISNGFEKIRANFSKYQCNFSANPYVNAKVSTVPRIFYNLVRATWGGQYNMGNLLNDSVCRFADQADPDSRDSKFLLSLNSIVRDDNSIYHKYLPEGSLERGAFLEIVNNFRSAFLKTPAPEQNKNLKALLNEPMDASKSWIAPARVMVKATHTLLSAQVPIFSKAQMDSDFSCGYLDGEFSSAVPVKVLFTDDNIVSPEKNIESWSYVEVPQYADFVHKYSSKRLVTLKDNYSVATLRSSGEVRNDNEIQKVTRVKGGPQTQFKLVGEVMDKLRNTWYELQTDNMIRGYIIAERMKVSEVPGTLNEACNSASNRGQSFWVRSDFLKKIPPEYTSGKKYKAVVIGKGNAFLRATANDMGKVLEKHAVDDKLTIVGQQIVGQQKWFAVLTASGDTAYMSGSRLQLVEEIRQVQ